MAEQIQNLVATQKRLLNDVSHELRSPLARLQVAIEMSRQQPDKSEELMLRIEKESQRLDELVGEVLTLSRLEAGVQNNKNDNNTSVLQQTYIFLSPIAVRLHLLGR